jgi:hypothetical protein
MPPRKRKSADAAKPPAKRPRSLTAKRAAGATRQRRYRSRQRLAAAIQVQRDGIYRWHSIIDARMHAGSFQVLVHWITGEFRPAPERPDSWEYVISMTESQEEMAGKVCTDNPALWDKMCDLVAVVMAEMPVCRGRRLRSA